MEYNYDQIIKNATKLTKIETGFELSRDGEDGVYVAKAPLLNLSVRNFTEEDAIELLLVEINSHYHYHLSEAKKITKSSH